MKIHEVKQHCEFDLHDPLSIGRTLQVLRRFPELDCTLYIPKDRQEVLELFRDFPNVSACTGFPRAEDAASAATEAIYSSILVTQYPKRDAA